MGEVQLLAALTSSTLCIPFVQLGAQWRREGFAASLPRSWLSQGCQQDSRGSRELGGSLPVTTPNAVIGESPRPHALEPPVLPRPCALCRGGCLKTRPEPQQFIFTWEGGGSEGWDMFKNYSVQRCWLVFACLSDLSEWIFMEEFHGN